VTTGVHAEVVVGKIALHLHLEAVDVGVVGDELVCGSLCQLASSS
jgi:hypothetical protein